MVFALFVILIQFSWSSRSVQPCHALVLAGGGARGAWQAGVNLAIANLTVTPWNVVTATSAGSWNAGLIAGYTVGQELDAALYAISFWNWVAKDDLLRNWPAGVLEGLFFESGLYSSEYARNVTFPKWISPSRIRSSGRFLFVGATSFETFEYRTFSREYHDILGAIVASSSFPGAAPPTTLDGIEYVDGGLAQNAPISEAIERCQDLGFELVNSTVDVVIPWSATWATAKEGAHTPYVIYRAITGLVANYWDSDYTTVVRMFPQINFRVFQLKEKNLPNLFDFKHDDMMKMVQEGYSFAEQILTSSNPKEEEEGEYERK